MFAFTKKILWIIPFLSFILGYMLLDRAYKYKDIICPNLVGKNIEQAALILSKLQLNSRVLSTKEDLLLEQSTILSQTPSAGQKIKQNQAVLVVISTKPEKKRAPSCIGKSFDCINQELTQQNINYKTYMLQGTYPQNSCLAQHPAPDQILESNKMIIYLCASNKKPIIIPNLKNRSMTEVIDFTTTNSIKADIMHYDPNNDHQCSSCIIIDQRPLAGSIIANPDQNQIYMQLQVQQK